MSRILVVEDEAHLAQGLRFNLEAEGYSAEVVADGEAATDRLLRKKENFDAIVLDIMPVSYTHLLHLPPRESGSFHRPHDEDLGSSIVMVVPWPSPALSANTLPPCFCAIDFTINRPSPVPFTCASERWLTR